MVKGAPDTDDVIVFDSVQDCNVLWVLSLHPLPHKPFADLQLIRVVVMVCGGDGVYMSVCFADEKVGGSGVFVCLPLNTHLVSSLHLLDSRRSINIEGGRHVECLHLLCGGQGIAKGIGNV